MKAYLVIWSECDSGFEIKRAFFDKAKADEFCKTLDNGDRNRLIADTERWIKEHKPSDAESHRNSTLRHVNSDDFGNHHVEEIEIL